MESLGILKWRKELKSQSPAEFYQNFEYGSDKSESCPLILYSEELPKTQLDFTTESDRKDKSYPLLLNCEESLKTKLDFTTESNTEEE